jgi:hypothetical protein
MLMRCAVVLAICLAAASAASGQPAPIPSMESETSPQPAGWRLTPSLASGATWDDNVLIQGAGDDLASDSTMLLRPGALLDYRGRLTQISASYTGSIQRYNTFESLSNYDQSQQISVRRRLSPRKNVFVDQSYSAQPTTAFSGIIGVPFLRIGSRVFDLRAGGDIAFTKRTSLTGSYQFERIGFDEEPTVGRALTGGRAHGGALELRHRLTARATLTAAYDLERAGLVSGGRFAVQNTWAGGEYALSDSMRVRGALGLSRLDATEPGGGASATAARLEFSRRVRSTWIDATYNRSFLPTYGAGGTLSNEEFTVRAIAPLGRRFYADGVWTWRDNASLLTDDPSLRSTWLAGSLGYAAQPWLHLEAVYNGLRQETDRPGGRLHRNQLGFQIVTTKSLRIR